MSTQPGQQTDFGANEWLVYEIHQQYLRDPGSVSAQWREFLSDYSPGAGPANGAPSSSNGAPAGALTEAVDRAAPSTVEPAASATVAAPSPPPPAAPPAAAPALKGAAALVVVNMEASLTVPTATSVRAVPAKLLADNRTVINNHLRRARGGKVSFTHLIGFALVKALAAVPVLNRAFGHDEAGKPIVLTPHDVGLGLAIDLQNANGTRSLVVAAIKRADSLDFAGFLAAYEDIVRTVRGVGYRFDRHADVAIRHTTTPSPDVF